MDALPRTFYLPDTMKNRPWLPAINPHFEAVEAKLDAWLRDFKALGPVTYEAFDKCGVGSYDTCYLFEVRLTCTRSCSPASSKGLS